MRKNDRYYIYTYDELKERLGLPDKAVILQKSVCLGRHQWRLETEGPEVFVAVCSRCGKRTTDPGVVLKLLDDFSPRRRRWMRCSWVLYREHRVFRHLSRICGLRPSPLQEVMDGEEPLSRLREVEVHTVLVLRVPRIHLRVPEVRDDLDGCAPKE